MGGRAAPCVCGGFVAQTAAAKPPVPCVPVRASPAKAREMKHSVDALRPYARWGSFILSCMTAVCAITFGYYQTDWWLLSLCCAVFFGIMSFSADYGLLFAREAYRKGEASTLTIVMVGWVFVFVLNVVAAVGSVGWQRKGEQHASKAVQQVSLGDQEAVASNAQLIAVTEGNIAEVTKNLTNTTSWSVEVVPTALKASIVSMEGDRVYARSKQCANVTLPESRSFCDKLAGLRGRLANVDAIAGLKDELRRLHEARDRLVAKSQTSFQAEKPSATLEQAGLFASFARDTTWGSGGATTTSASGSARSSATRSRRWSGCAPGCC